MGIGTGYRLDHPKLPVHITPIISFGDNLNLSHFLKPTKPNYKRLDIDYDHITIYLSNIIPRALQTNSLIIYYFAPCVSEL